jgi:hypothetical protein
MNKFIKSRRSVAKFKHTQLIRAKYLFNAYIHPFSEKPSGVIGVFLTSEDYFNFFMKIYCLELIATRH